MTEHRIIAGALYDFLGYITRTDPAIRVGKTEHPSRILDVFVEWAKLRDLNIDDAEISGWRKELDVEADAQGHKGI